MKFFWYVRNIEKIVVICTFKFYCYNSEDYFVSVYLLFKIVLLPNNNFLKQIYNELVINYVFMQLT